VIYPPARVVSNSITVSNSSVLAACPAPLPVVVPSAAAAVRVASLSADETPLPLPGTFVTPGTGVVIPIVLFSIKKIRLSRTGSLISALFVIAGIVMNRFNTSWFAMEPIGGVQYSPSWMEVAILVGVASGVLLAFTLMSRFFPVFKETVRVGAREAQATAASAAPAASAVPAMARREAA
jgi:hypothetical protein